MYVLSQPYEGLAASIELRSEGDTTVFAGLVVTLDIGTGVLVTGPVMWLKHNMAEASSWSLA